MFYNNNLYLRPRNALSTIYTIPIHFRHRFITRPLPVFALSRYLLCAILKSFFPLIEHSGFLSDCLPIARCPITIFVLANILIFSDYHECRTVVNVYSVIVLSAK